MHPLYEYVCHMKGHRNSKGELAEWVIKSHETGEILSSHKSEKKAKEHLQHMHIFGESVEGEAACSHCGWSADGVEEYNGRLLCPYCLAQFKWLDEHRDPEDGTYEKYDLVPREFKKSYKLIGESTYGNDMNKRIKIFMEGVSQLGLNSFQLHTIANLTQVCMESAMDETSEPRYVSHLFQGEDERNDIERMIDADGNIDNVVSEYGFLLDPSNPDNVTEGVPYILEGTDIIIGTSGPYTLAYNGKMAGSYLLYKKLDDDSSTTNACMEGVGDGVDTQDIDPNMNELDEYTDTPPETVDGTEEDEEHELTMDEMYDKLIEQGVSKQTINIVTDIIGWNPESMLKILYAATGYRTFDQLSEF